MTDTPTPPLAPLLTMTEDDALFIKAAHSRPGDTMHGVIDKLLTELTAQRQRLATVEAERDHAQGGRRWGSGD